MLLWRDVPRRRTTDAKKRLSRMTSSHVGQMPQLSSWLGSLGEQRRGVRFGAIPPVSRCLFSDTVHQNQLAQRASDTAEDIAWRNQAYAYLDSTLVRLVNVGCEYVARMSTVRASTRQRPIADSPLIDVVFHIELLGRNLQFMLVGFTRLSMIS